MSPEDRKERLDRELIELLNELRVVLPGIQVLFAFLLIAPFNDRFQGLTSAERGVYFVAVVATAMSSVLLIAPTAQHRVRWRARDKEQLLESANTLAIAGTMFLMIGIAAALYLVIEFVYDNALAEVVVALAGATMVFFWYGEPLLRRSRDQN